jgi:hypothetical protein
MKTHACHPEREGKRMRGSAPAQRRDATEIDQVEVTDLLPKRPGCLAGAVPVLTVGAMPALKPKRFLAGAVRVPPSKFLTEVAQSAFDLFCSLSHGLAQYVGECLQ